MKELLFKSKAFVKRNSPTILTCVGSVGVIATAVSTAKATPKVLQLLDEAKEEKQEELTAIEKIKIAGPAYVPSILIGAGTITCIFGANILNTRHQTSLVSAYTLLDQSYEETDKHVRSEIAMDHYEEYDDTEYDDEYEDGKILYYDQFSNRYFRSALADVLQAEYDLNRQLSITGGASINEFYEFLGLDDIPGGDDLGWSHGILESMYWAQWIEFDHEKVVMDDGLECYIITFRYEPVIDFPYY